MERNNLEVVGLGELLWDCFPDGRRPGGAPANVAFHASQLGCEGLVCSRVGSDPLGEEILQYLAEQGLDTQYIQRDSSRPTGTVTVDTSVAAHPKFTIHEKVAWDGLEMNNAWMKVAERASAICFGTLAQRSLESRGAIRKFIDVARDALVVYDVNLRPPFFGRETVSASIREADVVKLNNDEVKVLASMFELATDEPRHFAESLFEDYNVRIVFITRGGEGCLAVSRDAAVNVPGREIRVADSVGAGDAFTAALIWGHLQSWSLERTACFANDVGALVAGRPGAMPSLKKEFRALKQNPEP